MTEEESDQPETVEAVEESALNDEVMLYAIKADTLRVGLLVLLAALFVLSGE